MLETVGDIWEYTGSGVIVITTSGSVTQDGRAIFGRGVARQAALRNPGLAEKLGRLLVERGNHVFDLGNGIVSFPVEETPWSLPDLRIIARSAQELLALADRSGWEKIVVPRPGCGGGGLAWKEVKPLLEACFDHRFIVINEGMLHIIQNDPEVPPGNMIDHLTIPYIVHHPYRDGLLPKPEQISALIVLGGAMGANDEQRHPFLSDLKNLIRNIVAARTPYLGICLGGQLLAAALGAKVVSKRWEELGTMNVSLTEEGKSDRLFGGFPEEFNTFQWHHDSFDIPAGGILLASSAACPHQAFRVGDSAWGLQFHPEVTESIIRDWCAWDSSTIGKTEELVASFSCNVENHLATSRRLLTNFLQCAGMMK
jgi:GMP synthase-like glutamine amidotransferase